jgi:hypothetical protein
MKKTEPTARTAPAWLLRQLDEEIAAAFGAIRDEGWETLDAILSQVYPADEPDVAA